MKMRTGLMALLMLIPLFAQAEAYKCKQPNGSLSFQDQPCPAGAASTTLKLPAATARADEPDSASKAPKAPRAPRVIAAGDAAQDKSRDYKRRREEEEIAEHNREVKAYNKMQRCNFARKQLGVAKEARPIFRRDDKGDRQYVKDENRPAEISAAEQKVSEECN
jgi:Domain of unknown function (DUF4124)